MTQHTDPAKRSEVRRRASRRGSLVTTLLGVPLLGVQLLTGCAGGDAALSEACDDSERIWHEYVAAVTKPELSFEASRDARNAFLADWQDALVLDSSVPATISEVASRVSSHFEQAWSAADGAARRSHDSSLRNALAILQERCEPVRELTYAQLDQPVQPAPR